jgi:hypothetical protein
MLANQKKKRRRMSSSHASDDPQGNKILKFVFRDGSMSQVVEHLPNKCKTLRTNSRTTKKKKFIF